MDNIIVLEVKCKFGEMEDSIYPVILQDDKVMVLIDCGYTGYLPKMEEAMNLRGLDASKLTHILITHQDHDHMGCLSDFKEKYPHIQVVSSQQEEPYISGKLQSLRIKQAEQLQELLPKEQQEFGIQFLKLLRSVKPVPVELTVSDGDIMDWCGGCTIIATPGHTPGHISILVHNKKILIAGDAAVLQQGELVIANPEFTLDMVNAEESLHRLKSLGAGEILCYHGGRYII